MEDLHKKDKIKKELSEYFSLNDVDNCDEMSKLRHEIDEIDEIIVTLLKRRLEFILRASYIKKNEDDIRLEWRINQVIDNVKKHACEINLDQSYIEKIYEIMVDLSIEREMVKFKEINKN